MTNKSVTIGKKIIGLLFGLIVFVISSKAIIFLIVVISAASLPGSENHESLKNIEAAANILALLFGAVLFNKTYKAFTGTVLFRVWGFSKRKDNTTDK